MSLAQLKATTALVASLSLVLPHPSLVSTAWAQEVELLCLNGSEPPCPAGEPEAGSSLAERAEFAAAAAAAEAEALAAEEAAAAEAEALAAEEAATAEAKALAAEDAAAAEAEALAAEDAAAAEAKALAAEDAAAAEAKALAAEDAAAAEAEALAAEDAAAAEAEAEALTAEEAAAAEAEALAAEEAAAAEAEALAAEEATAEAKALAAEDAAAAEAEAAEQPEVVLEDPTVSDETEAPVAATVQTEAAPEEVAEETLDAGAVRTSAEEFATSIAGSQATAVTNTEKGGLSNLEKALLIGLGAVVVGSVLRNGDRVVENTGDRVVVEGARGLTVYKDDDALLRQPGASIRTETYFDGSTRTFVEREDGSQVVTIRDSRGRVLRRDVLYPDGTQFALFDDVEPMAVVDVQRLQDTRPVGRSLSFADNDLRALRAALGERPAFDAGRSFSLRQIREIEQVRSLVPAIDLDTVTFASGSAAIPAEQARSLVRMGIIIEELLLDNPREVFLIEGHTDAVGSDSFNLALSDRRAESVALALTEAFRTPPENLIVQGYGEAFLKVRTQDAAAINRRATVRRITPLLRQVAAN